MKNNNEYLTRINKLYNRISREYGSAVVPESRDLIQEMVLACICEFASQEQAEKILQRLLQEFVDFNEMRVCRPGEITDIIRPILPQAEKISENILLLLRGLFDQIDTLTLEELQDKGKKETRQFIDKLQEGSPFVKARILLRGIGIHAFPVNDAMINMFRAEDVIDPESDLAQVQAFLDRHIPAAKTLKMYSAFQYHADHGNSPLSAAASKTAKKTKTVTSATRKTKQKK